MTDFLKYLEEAIRIVATWPKWKQDGSDVTKFIKTDKD